MKEKTLIISIGVAIIVLVSVPIITYEQREIEISNPCFGIENVSANITSFRTELFEHLKMNGSADISVVLDQGNYTINEVDDIVLATLSSQEFQLSAKFNTFAGFQGFVSCSGFRKLASNPIVEYFSGNYYQNEIVTVEEAAPGNFKITDIKCVLSDNDSINATIKNIGSSTIPKGTSAFTIRNADNTVMGVNAVNLSANFDPNATRELSTIVGKGILIEGNTYNITITLPGNAKQTSNCTAQAGTQ